MKKLLLHPIAYLYLGLNCLINLSYSFFFVTYVPFLLEKGMNLLEVNIINSFFMIFVILGEMPTGSFADNFGRHRSLSLACLLSFFGFLLYYFSSSFIMFILAEAVLALGHTFHSGALEAWLVDSLKKRGEESLSVKVFAYEPTFRSIGVLVGVLIGAYIGEFDLSMPWLSSAILIFIIFILSLFLKENYRQKDTNQKRDNLGKQFKTAWNFGIMNKDLVFIMTFGACLAFTVQAINMQWPVIFQNEHDFSSFMLGWLFVGVVSAVSLGAHLAHKLKRFLSEKQAIIIPQLVTAIGIILCSYVSITSFMVTFFLLHEFSRGMLGPLRQEFINRRIESKNRATLLSLNSIFVTAGALVGLLFSGLIANAQSISTAWFISGSILLVVVTIFSLRHRKKLLVASAEVL